MDRSQEPNQCPEVRKARNGQADTFAAAVLVGRIATGETRDIKRDPGTEANRKGGLKGGAARAKKLSAAQRKDIAKKAAAKRWDRKA